VLAFAARRPRDLVIGLWIATVVVAGPSFVYYVNGFAQFGMRHALDFEPFVLVLMALAYPSRVPPWGRALIVWSVLVGIWGVWLTVVLYHHRELLVLVGRNDEYRYVQMTIRPANPGEHSRQRRLRGCRRREIPLTRMMRSSGCARTRRARRSGIRSTSTIFRSEKAGFSATAVPVCADFVTTVPT
jgi:hypothetical protein